MLFVGELLVMLEPDDMERSSAKPAPLLVIVSLVTGFLNNTGMNGGFFQGAVENILECNPTLSGDAAPLTIAKACILPTICAGRHKATCCDIVSGLGLVIVDKFGSFWRNPFGKPTHFNNLRDATVKRSLAIRFDQHKTGLCLTNNFNCCDYAHCRM